MPQPDNGPPRAILSSEIERTHVNRGAGESTVATYRLDPLGKSSNYRSAVPHLVPHFVVDSGARGWTLAHTEIAFSPLRGRFSHQANYSFRSLADNPLSTHCGHSLHARAAQLNTAFLGVHFLKFLGDPQRQCRFRLAKVGQRLAAAVLGLFGPNRCVLWARN